MSDWKNVKRPHGPGKGSDRRPMDVSQRTFARNWDAAFRQPVNMCAVEAWCLGSPCSHFRPLGHDAEKCQFSRYDGIDCDRCVCLDAIMEAAREF